MEIYMKSTPHAHQTLATTYNIHVCTITCIRPLYDACTIFNHADFTNRYTGVSRRQWSWSPNYGKIHMITRIHMITYFRH